MPGGLIIICRRKSTKSCHIKFDKKFILYSMTFFRNKIKVLYKVKILKDKTKMNIQLISIKR